MSEEIHSEDINPFKLIDDIPAPAPEPRFDMAASPVAPEPAAEEPEASAPEAQAEGSAQPTATDAADGEAAEGENPDGESPTDSEFRWYFVNCYSGYENKVKINLAQRIETMGASDLIKRVVVPTEQETEVKDGKRRTVERRLFPGYLLVEMKDGERARIVVKSTPGVSRFVGMGDEPTALSKAEVDAILHRMESEAPKLKVNFRVGQKVRITDGPFADFMGLVDKIDTERAKVSVLVSFFGRETPVELDFLQVERM